MEVKEGQIIYLSPEKLLNNPHPAIVILEQNEIFQIREEDIQKLMVSISQMDILQPVLVTEENGEIYRVAGKKRVLAAKKVGIDTVPCYIRKFQSEEEIIQAWTEENFARTNYTASEQMILKEKINQLMRKKEEISPIIENIAQKLSLDSKAISVLKDMPSLTEKINEILSRSKEKEIIEKVVKEKVVDEKTIAEKEKLAEELRKAQEEKNQLIKKIENLKDTIMELEERLEEKTRKNENKSNNTEEIERLQTELQNAIKSKQFLELKLKEKDTIIAEKERDKLKMYEELIKEIEVANNQMFKHAEVLIDSLILDADKTLRKIENAIEYINSRESLQVLLDNFQKSKENLIKKLEATKNVIVNKFSSITPS